MNPKLPCKFFARGYCMRGEKCRYSHNPPPQKSATAAIPSNPDPRSKIPCHHHACGHCRNGAHCPYSHKLEVAQKIESDIDPEAKHNHDTFTREFGGALIRFEGGASVAKVCLPADFSAARIDGLPAGSTPASVAWLLKGERFRVSPDCVRIRQLDGASSASADIKVDDPTFARKLCSKLGEKNKLRARYPRIEAFHVSPGLPSSTNAHRIECKKVQCSWYKPSKTAWLTFETEDVAERVCAKFHSETYTVLGHTPGCDVPRRRDERARMGIFWERIPLTWLLILTHLPATTTMKDVIAAIKSPQDRPCNVEVGKASYSADGEEASAIVMSLLLQAGPIEWSQVSTELKGTRRATAVARFYEESDARAAVTTLHDKPLPFCNDTTLTVQLVSTAKFKVASMIFNAVQNRIRTASQVWHEKHLMFKIYPSAGLRQQYRVLKIEGEVAKDVAAAKETLNEILDGITVMSDGKPLWNPSLISNGTIFQNLQQIQREQGVIILRNRKKQELKLFCSPEKYKDVERIITLMVNSKSHTAHIIELKPEEFRWACSGGFKTIVATVGENIATFDIVSTPKRILIGGTKKEYKTALKMIGKRESKKLTGPVASNKDCAVCWLPADNPIITHCNHVYCTECFDLSCNAASSSEKEFSIKCHGEMGKCEVIFSLEELQESLSSKAFEDILEASFSSHIKRHPQLFRYCPKPNCNTIYRVTNTMQFNTCSECCTVICTACHNIHENKTCAEYEDESSGKYEATLKLMKKLGIKSCPKCKITIEKTGGCNHITCKCGAHICWVCLEVFAEPNLCYDHMREAHCGIGLEY